MALDLIPEPLVMPDEKRTTVKLGGVEIDIVVDPRLPDHVAIMHDDKKAVVLDGRTGEITEFPRRR